MSLTAHFSAPFLHYLIISCCISLYSILSYHLSSYQPILHHLLSSVSVSAWYSILSYHLSLYQPGTPSSLIICLRNNKMFLQSQLPLHSIFVMILLSFPEQTRHIDLQNQAAHSPLLQFLFAAPHRKCRLQDKYSPCASHFLQFQSIGPAQN